MSDHDHLLPLPDPTPSNMARIFLRGIMLGAAVMLADILITSGLLGFETAFVTYALGFSTIFMITGALKDDSVPMIMSVITGIVVGALSTNLLNVKLFENQSLLSWIGL